MKLSRPFDIYPVLISSNFAVYVSNIDFWCTLEPDSDGCNMYIKFIFLDRNNGNKQLLSLLNPSFHYIKFSIKGYSFHEFVIIMAHAHGIS